MSKKNNWFFPALFAGLLFPGSTWSIENDDVYSAWLDNWDLVFMEALPQEPEFNDYLSLLASQSPELRARFYQWQAAEEKKTSVGSWSDPQLRVSTALEPVVTAQGPQSMRIGLSQLIPRPLELRSASEAQEYLAQASYTELQTHLNDLTLDLKSVYAQTYLLDQKLEIQKQTKLLLTNWQEVLLARYRSASASHPDLVKTQLELLSLDDQIQKTQVDRENSLDDLRVLLNLEPGSVLRAPTSLENLTITDSSENPRVLHQQANLNAAKSGEAVAKSKTRPQFILGMDWTIVGSSDLVNPSLEAGKDALALNIGMSLPVWGRKNKAVKASARSIRLAHEAKYEALTRDLSLRRIQVGRELEDADRRIKLLEQSLIPKSQEAYEVLEIAYSAGNADLLSLIDAVENLLDYQLQLVEAKVIKWQTQARLDHLKGSIR